VITLEEQVADLSERLTAQESHFEGIRSAILELRRDLLNRPSPREADVVALRQQGEDLRQRMAELEKLMTSAFAEVHRSIQMLIDRRDVTLLQRSVNETMRRVQGLETRSQAMEVGQQELRQDIQELKAGQPRIEQTLQQILAKLG
jgi:chromosome segregation ATPase